MGKAERQGLLQPFQVATQPEILATEPTERIFTKTHNRERSFAECLSSGYSVHSVTVTFHLLLTLRPAQ